MEKADLTLFVSAILLCSSLGACLGYLGQFFKTTRELKVNAWLGSGLGALLGICYILFMGSSQLPTGPAKPLKIKSIAEFETKVLDARQPVLVDFYADFCPPCRQLAPQIDKLAKEYRGRAVVAKVDVKKLPQLAHQFGIRSIPAVLFFQAGQETERVIGLRDKEFYASTLDHMGG